MTDNERMQCVMPDSVVGCDTDGKIICASFLLQQLGQRDQTIESLEMGGNEALQGWMDECEELRQQNTIMLSALERISRTASDSYVVDYFKITEISRDTIAKVKALPVSRQGETSDTSVPSEQP